MEPASIVKINKFDPLTMELPEKIMLPARLYLPNIRLKLYDLSMGGIIPGAALTSDAQVFCLDIGTEEDAGTEFEIGKFMEFVRVTLPTLVEMHRIAQAEFNKKALLD